MSFPQKPIRITLGAALCTIFVSLPAVADDTEIYMSQPESTSARPNVLFILDTSGSMDREVVSTVPIYDPGKTYDSLGCSADRIYYSTGNTPPSCGTDNWFPRTSLHCDAAQTALENVGGSGTWPAFGNPRARAAQFRSNEWRSIRSGETGYVECGADNNVHGHNTTNTTTRRYVRNTSSGHPWGSSSSLNWNNLGSSNGYRFYTANYLNYYNGEGNPEEKTRLAVVRDVAISLASSLQDVNLGLMRYNTNAQGGYVLEAIDDIATNRDQFISTLKNFNDTSGDGGTPLSETLFEAANYLRGGALTYGDENRPGRSVDASRTAPGGKTYRSPIQYQCQKNYIVYLTDGAPTVDTDANDSIASMIGAKCAADPIEPNHDGGWVAGSGICMDDLAQWLNTTDLSDSLAGTQSASTYMIGFGKDIVTAQGDTLGYLNTIAEAGGTEHAYTAEDVPTLTEALQRIFSGIQEQSSTFITPSISVNTFNRAQTSSDLYFSLFKVAAGTHWPGNLKKYKLDGTTIRDSNDAAAVDASGFFASGTKSIWSPTADGNDVTQGGAASQLPDPASRKLYTHLPGASSDRLAVAGNAFNTTNLTDALVGAGTDTATCGTGCENAINWARGFDVYDNNGDGSTTDALRFMGDPLHGRPGVVGYGGTTSTPDEFDTVLYFPTNDGFLHAISGKTGEELWAFIPPELLGRLTDLYLNVPTTTRSYGLDGDIQVLKFDKNQDGIVDPTEGDKVWLFFGMRAGGTNYYALDVTDRSDPELIWTIGSDDLPGVGQTWSTPVITRVTVGASGASNDSDERFVLIFGGGYQAATQENQPYSIDTVGNRVYMVDAESGKLLWFAGGAGTGTPNLALTKMTNSIPARVTVIDTDGDRFADRMYAADMGGRVWRFDIHNGEPAASLVTGGVIAQLGVGDNGDLDDSENRRFYNAPDVSLVQRRAEDPYYNIAIGSGYRGHPLDTVTQDRFYAFRDKQPYARLTQAAYNAITPIVDGDLVDITADPAGSPVTTSDAGWKLVLPDQPGRDGEKVLAEATTVNNVILFTTFQPLSGGAADPCYPANINRAYAVTVDTGKPALDFNDDGVLDNDDLSVDLSQSGIVGEISVALIRNGVDGENTAPTEPPTVCVAGVEVLKKCVSAGGTIRTFWQRDDAN